MRRVRDEHDDLALRQFWRFYDPLSTQIGNEVREACLQLPEFAELIRAIPPAQAAEQERRGRALQAAAINEGEWDGYVAMLRQQGAAYAQMGVSFGTWFEVLSVFRDAVRKRLVDVAPDDLARATLIGDGMNRLLDIAMATIGDAYLDEKEGIIRAQQDAIREISTPVLQIREQVLIVPIVGVVDTHRARHFTEAVLKAIRARRARAVIMDVTGVPIVDSKVAKHLAQTCESARLMGATVIVTGISPEIAQTLVTIGADLASVLTLGDLQSGVEEADRLLHAPARSIP